MSFNTSTKTPIDYFKRFTLGIVGGAEFINELGLLIGMRYTNGFNILMKKMEPPDL